MSLFGAGSGSFGRGGASSSSMQQSVNQEKVDAAVNEVTAVTQLYNVIQASCYSKCINKKFQEGDLTTGEGVCLDRCVSKFFATHQKMNDVLMQLSQQNAGP